MTKTKAGYPPDPITVDEFKTAMQQVASPVGIVTARSGKHLGGITSTAISPVSTEPPTIFVTVGRDCAVGELIVDSRAFAVNFLSQEQYSLARAFAAASEPVADPFSQGQWTSIKTGSPILDGCVSTFDCELENTILVGAHTVHFGRIVGITTQRQDVLLYCDGLFRRMEVSD